MIGENEKPIEGGKTDSSDFANEESMMEVFEKRGMDIRDLEMLKILSDIVEKVPTLKFTYRVEPDKTLILFNGKSFQQVNQKIPIEGLNFTIERLNEGFIKGSSYVLENILAEMRNLKTVEK